MSETSEGIVATRAAGRDRDGRTTAPATSCIRPDRHGMYHPASEDEIVALVRHARTHRAGVRVVGSGRSEPACIHTDAMLRGRPFDAIEICLDKLRRVEFDEVRGEVTVEAGCKIAHDPHDPTGASVLEEGLCWQLEQRGLALPVLTGGSCQSIGGYLGTGSDGGSIHHALGDVVVGLRFVDGRGEIHDVRAGDGDGLFEAAGVSLGLLGIITAVTFRPVPRFDIVGEEWGKAADEAEVGLRAGREHELAVFLADREYARIMWWPQPTLRRAVIWTARRMQDGEYGPEMVDADGHLVRHPYTEVPEVLGSPLPAQVAGSAVLTVMGRGPGWFNELAGDSAPARRLGEGLRTLGRRTLKPLMLAPFIATERQAPQRFWDTWWQGLPMDAQIDERLMPVQFTEMWFPMRRAAEVVARLREHFEHGGDSAAGRFVTELYAGKGSPFWLSPGYGEDQLRVNVFWHKYDFGDPTVTHFRQFWETLEDLRPRYHWGKSLPPAEVVTPRGWSERFPRWEAFMRLRAELDPDQLFVTEYWRSRFGIARNEGVTLAMSDAEESAVVLREPAPEFRDPPKAWPLVFGLRPARLDLEDRAEETFHNTVVVDVPIERAYAVATRPENGVEWISNFRGIDWLTEPHEAVGSASIETFDFMSFRMRTILADAPTRWVGSMEACTLPLADEMVSEWRFEALGPNRTRVDWWIRYTSLPWMKPFLPVVKPFFARLFRTSTSGLAAYLAAHPGGPDIGRRWSATVSVDASGQTSRP